jgi:glycosyltransferase involved in cell wall biosynthesis
MNEHNKSEGITRPSARLLFYVPSLAAGGAEMVVVTLANAFLHPAVEVHLVVHDGGGPLRLQLDERILVHDLRVSRTAAALLPLVRLLRELQPTALISALDVTNITALVARSLARVPCRTILSVHTMVSTRIRHAGSWQLRTARHLLPVMYRRADAIVAVSDRVADDLASVAGLPRSRITRIYNPLRPDLPERAMEPIDEKWFDHDIPVLVAVGRLVAAKDYPTMLRAVALLRQNRNVRLLILGDGPERDTLERLSETLGLTDCVRFLGFVLNPYPYMKRASAFVLSSAWEGFGMVLIEALACGTPIVSTDCDAGPAEILVNGKFGRLARAGDPVSLATAIAASLEEKHDPNVLKERAQMFSIEEAIAQYSRLIVGLV